MLAYREREFVPKLDKKRDDMVKPSNAVTLPLPPGLKAHLEAHDGEDDIESFRLG